jgi:peptide deformylase
MTVLPIFRMGADVLKIRSAEIADATDPLVQALVDDMHETMTAAHGIGLAAPQVGVPVRIVMFFVPAVRNGGEEIPLTVMVNPVIEPTGPDQGEDWEGCLSVPGLSGRVPRWTSIRYSFTDLAGQQHVREAKDYHARVVQHECDHLDGVLYPMRMTDMASLAYTDVLQAHAAERGQKMDLDEEGVPLE